MIAGVELIKCEHFHYNVAIADLLTQLASVRFLGDVVCLKFVVDFSRWLQTENVYLFISHQVLNYL